MPPNNLVNAHSKETEETDLQRGKRNLRLLKRVNYQVDFLPFPEGLPTEPQHYALLRFCTPGAHSATLGAVDNIITYILFSTKRSAYRNWALTLSPFPCSSDLISSFWNKARKVLYGVVELAGTTQIGEWEALVRAQVPIAIDLLENEELKRLMKTDEFVQCLLRYLMIRTSPKVGVRKVAFPGQVNNHPQACIMALEDLEADTYLWELNGVLSEDEVKQEAVSVMEAHPCQGLNPGPRLMAGSARFANHHCVPNSQLTPIPNHGIYVIRTLRQIPANEEVVVDYG